MSDEARTWYVYLLECADGTLYTGISTDPQRRLAQHNGGHAARYTRTRLPVRLLASLPMDDQAQAMRVEKQIKRWTPEHKRAFFAEAGSTPAQPPVSG